MAGQALDIDWDLVATKGKLFKKSTTFPRGVEKKFLADYRNDDSDGGFSKNPKKDYSPLIAYDTDTDRYDDDLTSDGFFKVVTRPDNLWETKNTYTHAMRMRCIRPSRVDTLSKYV